MRTTRRARQQLVHHPIFARVFDRLSVVAERSGQGEHRRELLAGLQGRVIEVGAGNGLNFAHYPPTVTEVLAVEPEAYLRARARKAARRAPVAVAVVDGVADRLPADEASFDAGVASLVLCSVPAQPTALAELFRVIRPQANCGPTSTSAPTLPAWPAFSRPWTASGPRWPAVATPIATR